MIQVTSLPTIFVFPYLLSFSSENMMRRPSSRPLVCFYYFINYNIWVRSTDQHTSAMDFWINVALFIIGRFYFSAPFSVQPIWSWYCSYTICRAHRIFSIIFSSTLMNSINKSTVYFFCSSSKYRFHFDKLPYSVLLDLIYMIMSVICLYIFWMNIGLVDVQILNTLQ